MTRDDIIRMAQEAGWQTGATSDDCMECSRFSLERFAALVAQREREACAKVAEDTKATFTALVIRARGDNNEP